MSGRMKQFQRLIDYLEWANRRALRATRAAGQDDARELLAHVLAAETVWLRRLEVGDSSGLAIWPELTFEECADRLASNVEALRRYVRSVSAEDLDRTVAYRNSKGRKFETPAGEILSHLLLHGAHHRGQIAMRLRDAGQEPVNTDFITFSRERPAEKA